MEPAPPKTLVLNYLAPSSAGSMARVVYVALLIYGGVLLAGGTALTVWAGYSGLELVEKRSRLLATWYSVGPMPTRWVLIMSQKYWEVMIQDTTLIPGLITGVLGLALLLCAKPVEHGWRWANRIAAVELWIIVVIWVLTVNTAVANAYFMLVPRMEPNSFRWVVLLSLLALASLFLAMLTLDLLKYLRWIRQALPQPLHRLGWFDRRS